MNHIIFDTETTGLLENSLMPLERQPYIIELFALKCDDDGNELDQWHSLFTPPVKLTEEIVKITGIHASDLAGAPHWRDRAASFMAFIGDGDVLVGHNLMFDLEMVTNELTRCDSSMADVWHLHMEKLCTVEATEHLKGFRLNLTGLHEYLFGLGFPGAHRAEADVRATKLCYFELLKRGLI